MRESLAKVMKLRHAALQRPPVQLLVPGRSN